MAGTFDDRAADVFAALEKHNPNAEQPMWWLRQSLDAQAGAEGSSSDDDEEQEKNQQERIELLRQVEQEEGGSSKLAATLPSASACKAFEAEDEEDAFDRLAVEGLQRLDCLQRPDLRTQVADGNLYDRSIAAGDSDASASPPTSPRTAHAPLVAHAASQPGPLTPEAAPQPAASALAGGKSRPRKQSNKRVRFREDAQVFSYEADPLEEHLDMFDTVPMRIRRVDTVADTDSSSDDSDGEDGAAAACAVQTGAHRNLLTNITLPRLSSTGSGGEAAQQANGALQDTHNQGVDAAQEQDARVDGTGLVAARRPLLDEVAKQRAHNAAAAQASASDSADALSSSSSAQRGADSSGQDQTAPYRDLQQVKSDDGGGAAAGSRRSYVPEHVRRPEDFICYTLDQPIIVGSGDDSSTAEQAAAAQAASSEVALSAEQPANVNAQPATTTASGSDTEEAATVPRSMQFVPRDTTADVHMSTEGEHRGRAGIDGAAAGTSASSASGHSGAGTPSSAAHAASIADEEQAPDTDMAMHANPGGSALSDTSKQRRRFRARRTSDAETEADGTA